MTLLIPHNLPDFKEIQSFAKQFPDLDPYVVFANLALLRVSSEVGSCFERFFSHHSLSEGRFGVMMILYRASLKEPDTLLSPADLAERAGVTRATITGLVNRLERDGLVTRTQRQDDRRMLSVSLTDKGKELLENIFPLHLRRVSTLYSKLTKDELAQFVSLLNKIQEGLEDAENVIL